MGRPKLKRSYGQTKAQQLKREMLRKTIIPKNTPHNYEWVDERRALCMDCGVQLMFKSVQASGVVNGWKTILLFGGDDHGIGARFKESPCRGPAGGWR